jgi:hypothetical protein
MALNGQIKARYEAETAPFTLRQEIRRNLYFSPFFDWLLNFFMGRDIDRPISKWQEMFLPAEVGNHLAQFSYTDETGLERPLVSHIQVWNESVGRPPVLPAPPPAWPWPLGSGCVIAALLIFFYIMKQRGKNAGRIGYGVSISLIGLYLGVVGSLLFFMTFFTNHDYTYHNANLIYVNPLLFAAVPLGIIIAKRGKQMKRAEKLLRLLWGYVCVGGVITQGLNLIPGLYQANAAGAAFVLPIAAVLAILPGTLALTKKAV